MSVRRLLGSFVAAASAVAVLAGCPVSSTWTTPRTIPDGTMLHTIGVDSFLLVGREGSAPGDGDDVLWYSGSGTHIAPFVFPAYLLRIGLGSRMDLGLKASTAGAFQADFKWQLIKTPAFDLALDPSVELSFVDYVSLPVLFGLNAGEGLTFTLGPRVTYLFVPLGADDATDQIFPGGVTVGGSFGVRIQLGPRLAVYPELTWLHALKDRESGELVTLGLGFSFGSGHPDYGPGSIEYVQE